MLQDCKQTSLLDGGHGKCPKQGSQVNTAEGYWSYNVTMYQITTETNLEAVSHRSVVDLTGIAVGATGR